MICKCVGPVTAMSFTTAANQACSFRTSSTFSSRDPFDQESDIRSPSGIRPRTSTSTDAEALHLDRLVSTRDLGQRASRPLFGRVTTIAIQAAAATSISETLYGVLDSARRWHAHVGARWSRTWTAYH